MRPSTRLTPLVLLLVLLAAGCTREAPVTSVTLEVDNSAGALTERAIDLKHALAEDINREINRYERSVAQEVTEHDGEAVQLAILTSSIANVTNWFLGDGQIRTLTCTYRFRGALEHLTVSKSYRTGGALNWLSVNSVGVEAQPTQIAIASDDEDILNELAVQLYRYIF